MPAAVNRVHASRSHLPAAGHRRALSPVQSHGLDPHRAPDPIRDAFLKGSWSNPAGPAATLPQADARTRAGMVVQLQRSHGNSYVQRTIAESRHFSPVQRITVQRCGGKPCNCSPQEQMSHAAGEISGAIDQMADVARQVAGEALAGEIDRTRGQGRALDPVARAKLESAMGLDLGHVSIHHDNHADVLARSVDAEAFTSGNDIYFRSGAYEPTSERGLRLLAHELTHTAQQGRGAVSSPQGSGGAHITDPGDSHELEADQTASEVMTTIAGAESAKTSSGRKADRATPERRALQRQTSVAGGLVVQRATVTDRNGPFVVNFKPFANLQGPPPQQPKNFDSGFSDSFDVAPGSSGRLIFLVDMDWTRTTGGGGPGPTPVDPRIALCDPCPKLPSALPNDELQGCFSKPDLCARRAFVDDLIKRIGDDPCILISDNAPVAVRVLKFICQLASNTILAPVLRFANGIVTVIRRAISAIANNPVCRQLGCAPVTPGGGPGPTPQPTVDRGTARATLETRYFIGADGKIQMVGAAPRSETNGVGAELVNPVEHFRSDIPGGATLGLQPMIKSSIPTTRPTGETVTETHTFQHLWEIDLKLPPPPAPIPFCFATRLFPFVTGKDRFEREEEAQLQLLTWFRTLDPRVRNRVFAAKTPVLVAGRASRLGSPTFDNLGLSEKRAKRVKQMVNDFGGSFAGVNTFAFGALTAQGPDINAAEDRRADVRVSGQLEGAEAAGGPLAFQPQFNDERPCADSDLPPLAVGGGGPAAITEGEGAGVPALEGGGAEAIPAPAPAAIPAPVPAAIPGGEVIEAGEGGPTSVPDTGVIEFPPDVIEVPRPGGEGGGMFEELFGPASGFGGNQPAGELGPGGEGGGLMEELFGPPESIGQGFTSESDEDKEFE